MTTYVRAPNGSRERADVCETIKASPETILAPERFECSVVPRMPGVAEDIRQSVE